MTYFEMLFIIVSVVVSCTAFVFTIWITCKVEDFIQPIVPGDAVVPLCLLIWVVQAVIIFGHIGWAIHTLDKLWFPVLP